MIRNSGVCLTGLILIFINWTASIYYVLCKIVFDFVPRIVRFLKGDREQK